jgi:hypothetical protein
MTNVDIILEGMETKWKCKSDAKETLPGITTTITEGMSHSHLLDYVEDSVLFNSKGQTPPTEGVRKKKSGRGTTTSSEQNPQFMSMTTDTVDCPSSQLDSG